MDSRIKKVLDRYPFLSYGRHDGQDYVGIVQNSDAQLISIYAIDAITDKSLLTAFLALGENWWWESNRQIPIHIFHKSTFKAFRPYLRHFARKEFDLVAGPTVSLHDTIAKRVRKRQITLVRRVD